MEQPVPTTAQNTNDDEEEEILIDTEDKQVVFTLAEVGRRENGDGIDTASPSLGPLRAVQLLKVASQLDFLGLPLPKNDGERRALEEKIEEIKAAVSSCIENSAVPFFDNLAKRGVAPSARDAAVSVSLCRKTESLFRKRLDDLDTSDVRRAGNDLWRLERGFGERKKPGLSLEWQNSFKERDAEARQEWLEQRNRNYERLLEERVSKLEEVADSGLPDEATGLHYIRVGGFSLGSWNAGVAINVDNVINRMLLDHKPLVERLAKLADKDYDALVEGSTHGFRTASAIYRTALTCKKRLKNDWSPVRDDELLKNSKFGKYTMDEEIYQLVHLRNAAIRKGIPVDVAERVMNWEVIRFGAASPDLITNRKGQPQFIDPDMPLEQKKKAGKQKTNKLGQPSHVFKYLNAPTKDKLKTMLEPGNCDLCEKGKPKPVEDEPGKWCCGGYYNEKSSSNVPCSQTWTDATLPRKHVDSLLSDEQHIEEFAAELRYLGASPEDVELVLQKWGVHRLTYGKKVGKWHAYLDENNNKILSRDKAKKRFGVATSAGNGRGVSTKPAAAEALDVNCARDVRKCLETIKTKIQQKSESKKRLYMEDLRETLTRYGFTGPPAPWSAEPGIRVPEKWPKNPRKMDYIPQVVRYLEAALEKIDAKAGSVGVGVDVDGEGVEDVDDALSGSAPAPAPGVLDSSDDDEMRAAKEASYEQFLTEQEAKLYGQIGSSDEKKESGSLSSDEPKYLGTNPPPAVAPVPVAAPAQVEVAEEPTPASSPRPPRLTGHDQDVADSEVNVDPDDDDEAEF